MRRVGLLVAILATLTAVGFATPVMAQGGTGSISGTITDATSNSPISGVPVVAFQYGGAGYGDVLTRPDGTYAITDLPSGAYQLLVGEPPYEFGKYVQMWWPGVTDDRQAGEVTVAAALETAGIDMALSPGGIVTGTVTDAWTGAVVGSGWVSLTRWVIPDGWFQPVSGVGVRSDGTFRVGGLLGEFRLSFQKEGYQPVESATFAIGVGEQLTVDLSAVPAYGTPFATVAGMVCEVEASSDPCWTPDGPSQANLLRDITVQARTPDGTLLGTTTTDAWGWFYMENLTPGTIVVSLQQPPSGMQRVGSETVTVAPNEGVWDVEVKVKRIDVHLALDSWISPTELAPDEDAELHIEVVYAAVAAWANPFDVSGVEVEVHLPPGLVYVTHSGDGRFSVTDGLWTIPTLPYLGRAQLTITVSAGDEGTARPHAEILASDWPDAAATRGDGRGDDYAEVTALIRVPPPPVVVDEAVIGGVVWRDDGDGLRGAAESAVASVTVRIAGADGTVRTAVTGDDGEYQVTELPAGEYRVSLVADSIPDDLEAATTDYVLTLGPSTAYLDADFGCSEVAASPLWWIVTAAAGVLLLAGAAAATWLVVRRRRRPPESEGTEPLPERVLV